MKLRQLSTFLSLLVILSISANLWWQNQRQVAQPSQLTCQMPIRWRLATLDSQFKLDQQQALAAIRTAAQAWNQQLGLALFVEDDTSGFPINFIYDERQQQLLAGQRLARNVKRYDDYLAQLASDLKDLQADHQQQLRAFERQNRQLTTQLQQGVIDNKTAQLQQAELQIIADGLNALAQKINDKNQHYNQSVSDRNQLVHEAAPTGNIAEVGLLLRTGPLLEMRIFAYRDHEILVRTLTHEFGHALGIEHLPEATAIMHDMLGAKQDQLTTADVAAAAKLCEKWL